MIQQTRIEREMLANTTAQLDDDILSYEWLLPNVPEVIKAADRIQAILSQRGLPTDQ